MSIAKDLWLRAHLWRQCVYHRYQGSLCFCAVEKSERDRRSRAEREADREKIIDDGYRKMREIVDNAKRERAETLQAACDSGMEAHAEVLRTNYVHFKNGHVETVNDREVALIAAAYEQGRKYTDEEASR